MEQFKHNLKIAFRNILKRKGQNSISLIGLSLGIVCFTFCMFTTKISSTLNYKFSDYKRIVYIEEKNKSTFSYWNAEEKKEIFESNMEGIKFIATQGYLDFSRNKTYFTLPDSTEVFHYLNILSGTEMLPDIFSIEILTDNKKEIFKTSGHILISESVAKKIYGNQSPIGCKVQINKESFTIGGIMKDIIKPNSLTNYQPLDLLVCLTEQEAIQENGHKIYVLLNKGETIRTVNKKIKKSGLKINGKMPEVNKGEGKIFSSEGVNTIALLYIGIGFLILGSGLINFLSINITTFFNRNKELIVRKITGSSSWNLFSLLFTEITILIVLAFLLSLSFTELIFPVIVDIINITPIKLTLPIPLFIKDQLLYFVFVWSFCAIVTYFAIKRLQIRSSIQGIKGKHYNKSKHYFRNTMLGIQFFVTILFVGTTIILQAQTQKVKKEILPDFSVGEQKRTFLFGFQKDESKENKQIGMKQLTNHPGIEETLYTEDLVYSKQLYYYKTNEDKDIQCRVYSGNNFVSFFHLSLLSGENTLTDPNTIIISRSLFNEINTKNYNGYLYQWDRSPYRIVGIVEDFETTIASGDSNPYVVIKPAENPIFAFIKTYPGYENEVENHIKETFNNWFPETRKEPFKMQSIETGIQFSQKSFAAARNVGILLSFICISLTLLGVYSAILADTEKRQAEASIRKVNGASTKNIVILFGKTYIYIYCISFILSLPAFYMICRFISHQFNIVYNFHNPLLWIGIFLSVLFLILLMISYRVYKISHKNPAEVIKIE